MKNHKQKQMLLKHTRIQEIINEEIKEIQSHVHKDKTIGETISLVESVLLDVDRGEVLKTAVYERDLLAITRPKNDWRCRC
jgi:hypothetical protein